jgi:hypothetical protein
MDYSRIQPKTLAVIASLIIVVLALFAPVIPLTVQEPYEDIETYTELEEYTAQVPYSVTSNTTELDVVMDHTFALGPVTFAYVPLMFHKEVTITISWNSSKEVSFFAVMLEQHWDDLYYILSLRLGQQTIMAMLNGTDMPQETVDSIPTIMNETLSSLPKEDYYAISSSGEISSMHLMNADYSLIAMSFGEVGTLNATLFYTFERPVTRIEIREETMTRNVTKTRPVTKTREVDKRVTLLQFIMSGS